MREIGRNLTLDPIVDGIWNQLVAQYMRFWLVMEICRISVVRINL